MLRARVLTTRLRSFWFTNFDARSQQAPGEIKFTTYIDGVPTADGVWGADTDLFTFDFKFRSNFFPFEAGALACVSVCFVGVAVTRARHLSQIVATLCT